MSMSLCPCPCFSLIGPMALPVSLFGPLRSKWVSIKARPAVSQSEATYGCLKTAIHIHYFIMFVWKLGFWEGSSFSRCSSDGYTILLQQVLLCNSHRGAFLPEWRLHIFYSGVITRRLNLVVFFFFFYKAVSRRVCHKPLFQKHAFICK